MENVRAATRRRKRLLLMESSGGEDLGCHGLSASLQSRQKLITGMTKVTESW
jgi:hypothetical protein